MVTGRQQGNREGKFRAVETRAKKGRERNNKVRRQGKKTERDEKLRKCEGKSKNEQMNLADCKMKLSAWNKYSGSDQG